MTANGMPPAESAGKPIVIEQHGRAITNSRDVAVYFERDHKGVLRAVRKLIEQRPDLNRRNFAPVEMPDDKGELRPTYDMDRDGFTLIAVGFTGPKALRFKLAYIEAFNHMEAALKPSAEALPEHRDFPDWPLEETRTKRGVAELYRMVYGPLSAQWIMPQLGFPVPPANFNQLGRQLGLGLDGLPPHPDSTAA